jgi:ABC-2 type transport system ATP-binding protein
VLRVAGLRKRFGEKQALDGVSFDVRAGEMFGFVGANGAGKTTTMRIVMGVLGEDAGEVSWEGQPLTLARRRRFGYIPEERGLYQKMTVIDQVTYFGRLHGMTAQEARRAADAAIERFGLTARRKDHVEKLSLGNQQRVQLAVALVHDPDVLIMDEPFSGLDPHGVDTVAEVLLDQCRQGTPVLFSSHQLDLVERLCHSVGIIAGGRMVVTGPVDEVRAAAGRRQLRVVVRGASPGWATTLPGVKDAVEQGEETLLTLDEDADDQAVLLAAAQSGRVEHFGWHQPTLVETFREVVQS